MESPRTMRKVRPDKRRGPSLNRSLGPFCLPIWALVWVLVWAMTAGPISAATVETSNGPLVAAEASDGAALRRALINLIDNGLAACREAGRTEQVELSLELATDGSRIVVRDAGVGIEPENLERIFQPDFTTKSDGMGLGPAVVENIVIGHGGAIEAASRRADRRRTTGGAAPSAVAAAVSPRPCPTTRCYAQSTAAARWSTPTARSSASTSPEPCA